MTGPAVDHLFVYGSLRSDVPRSSLPAEALEAGALLAESAVRVGRGVVAGALFAVDWYPGLAVGGGEVFGEVWRLPPDPALLGRLDAYEGDAYVRRRISVRMDDARQIEAWAYHLVETPGAMAQIAAGDYLQWLARHRG